MKQFNLQEALSGKPVVTRDGRKVKIAGYNPEAKIEQRILGWIDNDWRVWSESGKYLDDIKHNADLFMAPEPVDLWVLVLGNSAESICGITYHTLEEAQDQEKLHNISDVKTYGIHKITVEI